MVVAIATTLVVSLSNQHQLDIRRASNMINSDQAYQHALGAETWAMALLYRDKQNTSVDNLKEDWAQVLPPTEVPGGYISGQITDLQGRININNLLFTENINANPDPNNNPDNDQPREQLLDINLERNFTAKQILALLTNYQIQNQQQALTGRDGRQSQIQTQTSLLSGIDPQEFLTPLIDWMDPDFEPRGVYGAEDQYYLGLEHPYRPGNQIFVSVSELRLVKGVTTEIYNALAPHLVALPVKTAININTASLQVLTSLGIDASTASTIITERMEKPFESIEAVTQHPMLRGINLSSADLTIMSHFFLLEAVAEIGNGRSVINSILYREKNGKVRVLFRALGQL